jgi:Txe/YoeB family toxin of Txe-Axe toxin-antitoxin module
MKLITKYQSEADRKKYTEYLDFLKKTDPNRYAKIKAIYDSICQSSYEGIGNPHPLRDAGAQKYSGWWSRHITGSNVVIYRVSDSFLQVKELDVNYHSNASLISSDPHSWIDPLFHESVMK